jgi:hypothetical protein
LSVTVPGGNFVCECCGLWYPIQRPLSADIEARMHQSNKNPTRCARCAPHRQTDDAALVLRAEDHARWYWEQYHKAVDAARDARREMEELQAKAGDARDRMIAAYKSRDHGTRLLRWIGLLHEPAQRGCSCGKRPDCDTAKIIDQGWVQERVRDLDRREERDRQRARQLAEEYGLPYDEDDDYDEDHWVLPGEGTASA